MTVCIDTNVVLQARSRHHPFGVILDGFAGGRFVWAVTYRIMLEYEEIVSDLAGEMHWHRLLLFMQAVSRRHRNLRFVDTYFEFHVIGTDRDDNAFTDCAISANADFVITEDKHFAPLANAGYKPQPVTPGEFIQQYRGRLLGF